MSRREVERAVDRMIEQEPPINSSPPSLSVKRRGEFQEILVLATEPDDELITTSSIVVFPDGRFGTATGGEQLDDLEEVSVEEVKRTIDYQITMCQKHIQELEDFRSRRLT